jgi:hypothetical protein
MAMPAIDSRLLFVCCLIRAYENTTNRKTIDKVKTALGAEFWEQNGFHFNRFSEYLGLASTTLQLNSAIAEVCAPMMPTVEKLILDGTGIGLGQRTTYLSEMYGIQTERQRDLYVRLNLIMDPRTKMFPACIVTRDTGKGVGETSQVPYLLKRLEVLGYGRDRVLPVLADKLYGQEPVVRAIEEFGGRAVIALKEKYTESRPPRTPAMRRLHAYIYADMDRHRDEYRFRPLVECGIWSLKAKFKGCARSHTFRAQVNEVLFGVLCHNIDCLIHEAQKGGINIDSLLGDLGMFQDVLNGPLTP